MEESLKYFLERTTPLGTLARIHRQRQLEKKYRQWQEKGAVAPMPNFGKQQVVIEYIKKYSPAVFIETGTYKGKMVYAVMPYINQIYSIELDRRHYQNARRRFAGYSNIHIIQGQSGEVLPQVLKDIDKPCLFWLDAHYSGGSTARADMETPIMQEMECILNHPCAAGHIVLIDDARCFIGKSDYPTLEALREFIRKTCPDWVFKVENDIIRAHADKRHIHEPDMLKTITSQYSDDGKMGKGALYLNRRIKDLGDRIFGRKYGILEKIVEEFDKRDVCPDVLYLGDSTVLRVSNEDEDKRSTADMLAADLKGKARVLEISHGAYHMEVFYHLLSTLKVTCHRPRLIILPINMRSFSPQWYLRPNWQFRPEIELLISYYSGHGLRKYYRKYKYQDGYEKIPVEFPLSDIRTIGEFEELRLNKNNPSILQEMRRKELFIYFYLYPISKEHPRLINLMETVHLARSLDSKTMFYIAPINIAAAIRYVGREFVHYFSENLKAVKEIFVKEKIRVLTDEDIKRDGPLNDSVVCLDYSQVLGSDCFFHTESIDDHLNQKGRGFISRGAGTVALKLLVKDRSVGKRN